MSAGVSSWRLAVSALLAGAVFGAGLAISGMIDPGKVLAFLDVAGGAWDPSLLFVLGGAVGVTLLAFGPVLRRPAPAWDHRFHLPQRQQIDGPLLLGSALFGVGWGLSGYCPGPAMAAALAAPGVGLVCFLGALVAGVGLARWQQGGFGPARGTHSEDPAVPADAP